MKNRNLVSVLLGSNESSSLIFFFSFQNLSTSAHLPHFCYILSTCFFMDFPFPALFCFFGKKNLPRTPVFLILPFQITRISASFFSSCHFSKVEEVWPHSS